MSTYSASKSRVAPRANRPTAISLICLGALSTGCEGNVGERLVHVTLTIVAIVVAVRFPKVCLRYGTICGIWTATYGPFSAFGHLHSSTAHTPWFINLGTLTPFLVVNEMTTLFWVAYAWLIAQGLPFGGCGTILGLLTVGAVLSGHAFGWGYGLELSSEGFLPVLFASVIHIGIGIVQIAKMRDAMEVLRRTQARAAHGR